MEREDPAYHRGQILLAAPDPDGRTEVPVTQIGKGMWTRAYLTKTGTPYVYLRTKEQDSGDYSKRQLAELADAGDYSPYLPRLVDVGCDEDGYCFYRMPFYNAPLRKKNAPKAWEQYKNLKQGWEWALGAWRQGKQSVYDGHRIMDHTIRQAKVMQEHGMLPAGLIRALELLQAQASMYGADYSFEFSPRNLASTDKGHLILLDTVYSMEALRHARR